MSHLDTARAEQAVKDLLIALGIKVEGPIANTPGRVARAYVELFEGLYMEPPEVMLEPKGKCDEMIILKDIDLVSICLHHLLPFRASAAIAYIPKEDIVGLSKLPRIVHYFARRPQIQEALSNQIADFIMEKIDPLGVMVVIQGKHECVSCRGIREKDSTFITSAIRGIFQESLVKSEAISLLKGI